MGIEWFRDLSITLLGFISTAVLIFVAILAFRLYHTAKSTMLKVKEASQKASETIGMVQEIIKPVLQITSLLQVVIGGCKNFTNMFKRENN
jgi:hypothetical protein